MMSHYLFNNAKHFGALVLLALVTSATSVLAAQECRSTFQVTKTADTFDGNCSLSDCSLREAIQAANTCPGTQTIYLPKISGQSYKITRQNNGVGEDQNVLGDFDIKDSVNIIGSGTTPSIIFANDVDRVFDFLGSSQSVIKNVTILKGKISDTNAADQGGAGIRIGKTASVEVTNTEFTLNSLITQDVVQATSSCGGAIYNEGTLLFSNSKMLSNYASIFGGAICNANTLYISNVEIKSNAAGHGGGGIYSRIGSTSSIGLARFMSNNVKDEDGIAGAGGAIYIEGSSIGVDSTQNAIFESLFQDNSAKLGGAIFVNPKGDFTVSRSEFTKNIAVNSGAVMIGSGPGTSTIKTSVFNANSANFAGAVSTGKRTTIFQSFFVNNSAQAKAGDGNGWAGAIYAGGEGKIDSCVFESNSAEVGGAISSGQQDISIFNSSFHANHANSYGAALFVQSTVGVKNCTVMNNTSADLLHPSQINITQLGGKLEIAHTAVGGSSSTTANCRGYNGPAVSSFGYNISDDASCSLDASTDRSNIDPGLRPPVTIKGPYIGYTYNPQRLPLMLPLENGAAANSGSSVVNTPDDAVQLPGCTVMDAWGAPRPVQGLCDIGAAEL